MKELKARYHRHAYAIKPLTEIVAAWARGEPDKFIYCDICKCVPTDLVAKEEYIVESE